jgi:ABC-2 type transport system ATP-binding protein
VVTPSIETRNLNKVYGTNIAVSDLSLEVAEGEVFGFLGPNGAGKTTTIKMLLGLVAPSGGEARILGEPVASLMVRRQVGFLPELFRFHDWLTGEAMLRFHGRLYNMNPRDLEARIPEVLRMVGLAGRGLDRIRTYSKGMQQRVGLAQAILARPRVVFLDEPTSALDPLGRREVREIIAHLKSEGMTVFLNSHLLTEVELTCDRVAIVNHGQVVRAGRIDDLTRALELEVRVDHVTPELRVALEPFGNILTQTSQFLRLEITNEDTIPSIAETIVRSGARLFALTPVRANLEELFVALVQPEQPLVQSDRAGQA